MHLGLLQKGRNGSLCLKGVVLLPSVVVGGIQFLFSGPRCSGSQLVKYPPKCVSSIVPYISSAGEFHSREPQAAPGGPILACKGMFSSSAQALLQFANASPHHSQMDHRILHPTPDYLGSGLLSTNGSLVWVQQQCQAHYCEFTGHIYTAHVF